MAIDYSLPVASWFSGHLHALQPDKLAFMERCELEFPLGVFRIYHRPLFIPSDPALVGEVLVHRHEDYVKTWVLRSAARPLFGEGLVTSSGETWKKSVTRMRPRFQPRQVDAYVGAIHRRTLELLGTWRSGDTRDIPLDMSHLTLGIACDVLFGVSEFEIRDALLSACNASQAFYAAWEQTYFPLPAIMPTAANVRYRRAIAGLDRRIYGVIERRRIAQAKGEPSDGNIVAQLIEHREPDGEPMADPAIRDELVTLFLAAYETTAAMIAWALYLIVTHPEVKARVSAELANVLDGALPGSDVPRRLPYLRDVMRETLRLYPSIPILGRAAIRDTEIGGTRVPTGSEILISPWALHRSSRHYADPLVFRPERWTKAFEDSLPRYAYIPFSAGPRVCLGRYMAEQESMQILATLLQFADLQSTGDTPPQLDAGLTAVPRRGTLTLRVGARQRLPAPAEQLGTPV